MRVFLKARNKSSVVRKWPFSQDCVLWCLALFGPFVLCCVVLACRPSLRLAHAAHAGAIMIPAAMCVPVLTALDLALDLTFINVFMWVKD